MKSTIRILTIAIGGLLVLLVLLAAYLFLVFDPNDYRDRVAEQVRAQTGRELTIAGDIGLSVFPWLGVRLENASLGNAAGFGEQPFARVAQVEARARLTPLFRGEIEVDRIVLGGLELNLERNAEGRGNWEDLVAEAEEPEHERPAAKDPGEAMRAIAGVAVSGIEIESARVSLDDRQGGVRHEVHNLGLRSGEIRAGSRFPLEVGFDVNSTAPELSGRLDLSGQVLLDPDRSRVNVEKLELRFAGRGAALPGGEIDAQLRADMDLDLAAGSLEIPALSLQALGVAANGRIQGRDLFAEPRFDGSLDVAEFKPRELMQAIGVDVPKTADPAVLERASLKSTFEAGTKSAMFKAIELQLDDSRVTGEAGLSDLARQAIRFDLSLDAIDVDRYLPPRADAPAPAAAPAAAAAAGETDASGLRALNLEGKMRIGRLIVSGLTVSDIEINARAADGVLRVAPIGASLYEGRYAGNVSLDARGRAMKMSADESLSGVQIGPLLRDLTGESERLTGNAHLRAKLQATGNDADAMKRSLGGNAEFRFADGAVKGVNIAQYLREAQARLRGQPVPAESGPNQTDFTELTGTLQIANGVVRNDDLKASSPLLRIAGNGSADLGSERIDYRIRASLVGTLEGQGGAERDALRGVTVPIKVSGTFAKPSYALDVETLVAENVKQQVRGRIEEKVQEQLKGGTQDSLRKGLEGLLRR